MIDISTLSEDELIELRNKVNGKLASLTLQKKRKEDPKKYSCRTMDLYFKKDKYKEMTAIEYHYKDYVKERCNGRFYDFGDNGVFYVIRLWAPTEIRKEILSRYEYRRIYKTYTPERKELYPGYVIERRAKREETE